jgi:WhiB family transcriptional regulator, redox-sensing transcriptional regulator
VIPGFDPFEEDEDWQTRASCRDGIDDETWYPRTKTQVRSGKRVCNGPDPVSHPELGCPVKRQCLIYALKHGDLHGIWGGLDQWERARLMGHKSPTHLNHDAPPLEEVLSKI